MSAIKFSPSKENSSNNKNDKIDSEILFLVCNYLKTKGNFNKTVDILQCELVSYYILLIFFR